MKALYDRGTLKLNGESELENKIVASTYLKTKLAYIPVNDHNGDFHIVFGSDKSMIDLQNNTSTFIGNDAATEGQIGYMLRVIVDAYVLHRGGLPLHASMVSLKDKSVFLFGNTNSGKSTIALHLEQMERKCKLVGDDHIIVSSSGFFGNSVLRQRSSNNHDDSYKTNYTSLS